MAQGERVSTTFVVQLEASVDSLGYEWIDMGEYKTPTVSKREARSVQNEYPHRKVRVILRTIVEEEVS